MYYALCTHFPLDCGANIGMVTTVIAAMGRKVVSVDPLKEHLSYLRKALELLGNEDNVRLLHNAVRYCIKSVFLSHT